MKSKHIVAFTLIELLVVIAIVGILSGFVLVSLNSATNQATDARRKSDLSQIVKALLVYNTSNPTYPVETCSIGSTCSSAVNDALGSAASITGPNNTYYTYSSDDGTSFTVSGTLSNTNVYSYNSETGYNEASAEQGLPGYAKRQLITINASTALTDYQVKLTIAYDSDMQPDFDDLRFTSSDGTTELNYWLESKTDSTSALVWVKVPTLSSGDNTIYMYYANASATTASNGDNTFEFFDDFEGTLSNWTITGTATTLEGIITITNAGSKIVSISNFGVNYSTKIRLRADSLGGSSSN
jgi:prepilin-type N-terminal cleavage/methylation domain-containing protein